MFKVKYFSMLNPDDDLRFYTRVNKEEYCKRVGWGRSDIQSFNEPNRTGHASTYIHAQNTGTRINNYMAAETFIENGQKRIEAQAYLEVYIKGGYAFKQRQTFAYDRSDNMSHLDNLTYSPRPVVCNKVGDCYVGETGRNRGTYEPPETIGYSHISLGDPVYIDAVDDSTPYYKLSDTKFNLSVDVTYAQIGFLMDFEELLQTVDIGKDSCSFLSNDEVLELKDQYPDEFCTCDNDKDCDDYADVVDNCPSIANPDQMDSDDDGKGNACDKDWLSIVSGLITDTL